MAPLHEAQLPVAVAVHDPPGAGHVAELLREDFLELRQVGPESRAGVFSCD